MKGTEKYVRETDLSKKVADWQGKLAPILKEQDAHPPFDIHACGNKIVQHLETRSTKSKAELRQKPSKPTRQALPTDENDDDDDEIIAFDQIVGGLPQYQVCRMFLASLQLANNGNVELKHGKTATEQQKIPFQMQLLTTASCYASIQQPPTASASASASASAVATASATATAAAMAVES